MHGQSCGGTVAAKGAEPYGKAEDGIRSYDGVILTNGVTAGGTRNYRHQADPLIMLHYYCHNPPRQDEPQYPFWTSLLAESKMTGKDLGPRVVDYAGVKLPV